MIDYNEQLRKLLLKLCKILDLPLPRNVFKVIKQDKISSFKIPDLGKKFGTIYDKNGDLILASWLFELSVREQKILIEFLLTREIFRLFFENKIGEKTNPYERFTDIILQTITMLWYCQQNKIQLHSAPMMAIKGRADAFSEEDILKSEYWVYFLINSVQLNISPTKLFQIVVEQTKDAIEEERAIYDLAWDTMYWLKAHLLEEVSDGLPIYIEKKRHFDLIEILGKTKFADCSALSIGKITNRSYNVVNRDFQQIMDKYELFWWTNIELLKLRLYPYFFRINLKKIEQKNQLLEKLKTNRYIRNLRECEIEEKALVVGWLECPLIVYEQLAKYFEKLYKMETIEEYFIKQVRRKKITWTITSKKLQPTTETYQKLFAEPEKLACKTITTLDEEYDITSIQKKKKERFNEDVLMFISTLLIHHIGKTHYKFMPMELFYELCERNNIDSANSAEVTYYINQMDMRCRRLDVYKYFINFRRQGAFKKAIYVEIPNEQDQKQIEIIIEKLAFTNKMECLSLADRYVIIFPEAKYESQFGKAIEIFLKENKVEYRIYQLNYHRELRVPLRFLYNEAYDYTNNNWLNNSD